MTNPTQYRSVLLFGPPGAGKGTQGKILGSIPGFFHLSVGDVFRSIDIGSELGQEVCQYTAKGKLVPDELTIKIWKNALDAYVALSWFKPREDLLVLDGIPRTVPQTELVEGHIQIVKVIHLQSSNVEDMILRMQRRAIRENRADDADEKVIRKRFEVYRAQTEAVLDCYPKEMIADIEAKGSPAEVLHEILQALIPIQNQHFTRQN
ncbi:MAG: nucleoside monophosphate kinase [Planctomycetota bacterium]